MEKLRVSKNGRYLETHTGKPFFYLADTAWTIANKLSPKEVNIYFDDRIEKGFNVIQMVLLDPETKNILSLYDGTEALEAENNPMSISEKYWEHMDWIIELANQKRLYITLLPVWGQFITGDNWADEESEILIDEHNANEYGQMVGKHYNKYNHIIWCLGGDRHPIHRGRDYRGVWRKMAEGLAEGVLDKKLKWNSDREDWKDILITYHPTISDDPPCFSSSQYFQNDEWISFHMLQSGHRDNVRSYDQIYQDINRTPRKPVIDGEPNYEDWYFPTPDGGSFHTAWNVRKRAYWAVFAGAFGHTYGHVSVWRMLADDEKDDTMIYSWQEALQREGACQMKYLRKLVESVPFEKTIPAQEMLGVADNYLDIRREARVAEDGSFVMVYFTSGGQESIDVSRLQGEHLQYYWISPRDGEMYNDVGMQINQSRHIKNNYENIVFRAPTKGKEQDWILIIGVI